MFLSEIINNCQVAEVNFKRKIITASAAVFRVLHKQRRSKSQSFQLCLRISSDKIIR